MKGFTLIELIVVLALMGMLTAIGTASYSAYNSTQTLQSASADVVNLISTAKSRAISQVKPSQCGVKTLSAYQIVITAPGSNYVLNVICGGTTYLIQSQKLPSNVTFPAASATSVTFAVSSGTTAASSTVQLTGYGKTRTITIEKTGNILTN